MPKNTRRDTHKTRKSPFLQLETTKNSSCLTENLSKKQKTQKIVFFSKNISGESHSAESPAEATFKFFNIHSFVKYQQIEDIKKFRKKSLKAEKGSLIVSKKVERGSVLEVFCISCFKRLWMRSK